MFEKVITVFSLLVGVVPFFFWIRGIVRGNKGDLRIGLILLVVTSLIAVGLAGASGIFSQLGVVFFLLGIATLVAGSFAKADCLIKRQDRIALASLFMIIGLGGALVL